MRSPNQFPQTRPNQASNPFDNPFGDAVPTTRQNPPADNPFAPQGGYANPNVFPSNFDPFTLVGYNVKSQPTQEWSPTIDQAARLGERLRDKARPVMELGKRAVSAIIQLAPRVTDKLKVAYSSDYGQKITGMAQGAAGETAKAALWGGAQVLGEQFGVNYENGQLNVRKAKLAREAIRFAVNPYGRSVRAAKLAGREAYVAGRQEARSQANTFGTTIANDAFGYARSRW